MRVDRTIENIIDNVNTLKDRIYELEEELEQQQGYTENLRIEIDSLTGENEELKTIILELEKQLL